MESGDLECIFRTLSTRAGLLLELCLGGLDVPGKDFLEFMLR